MADIRRAGSDNIYTVLAFIAFLALLAGVGYLLARNAQVFGGNPFDTEAKISAIETDGGGAAGGLAGVGV